VVAISSIISGVFIIGISSWYLHHVLIAQSIPALDEREEPYYRAIYLVRKMEIHFDIGTHFVADETDQVLRVLVLCTGTSLFFGLLQCVASGWLVWAAFTDQFYLIGIWFLVQLANIVAIGCSYLVLLVNSIEFTHLVHLYLAFTTIEILTLAYFVWILLCFSDGRQGKEKKAENCWSLLWSFDKIVWLDVTNPNNVQRMTMV